MGEPDNIKRCQIASIESSLGTLIRSTAGEGMRDLGEKNVWNSTPVHQENPEFTFLTYSYFPRFLQVKKVNFEKVLDCLGKAQSSTFHVLFHTFWVLFQKFKNSYPIFVCNISETESTIFEMSCLLQSVENTLQISQCFLNNMYFFELRYFLKSGLLFCTFSYFYQKSMKKYKKVMKSKFRVFLMWCP